MPITETEKDKIKRSRKEYVEDHPHWTSYDDSCLLCWHHVRHNVAPHRPGDECPICDDCPVPMTEDRDANNGNVA